MKEIRINFEGFSANFDYKLFLPYKILLKHFDVKIVDNPDYLFCSGYHGYRFCAFKGIRIFYMGEVFSPDFNLVDYAINFADNFQYEDRAVFIPGYAYVDGIELLQNRKPFTIEDISRKSRFCNFIYSWEGIPKRTELFKLISTYKQVDSAGKYLNNMNGFPAGPRSSAKAGFTNQEKWNFQRNYKFSIACENYVFPSYITEKIIDAYIAETIPIYYGHQSIKNYFNPKSFINYSDYSSDSEFLEHIKKIDNNDSLYLEMLNQEIFIDRNLISDMYSKLQIFILNIFNQDYNNAFRRPKSIASSYEDNLLSLDKILQNRLFRFIYRCLRKIKII
ncbi:MAG: hypothetical protein LBE13_17655 [Bacteroidales bacterium]|jgi:uncharacterized protein YozE (UPF0346 family)|nr:hypothetical protein [Bacteroidales bacterium]